MDHLYQLLCIPTAPSLNINDLNTGNFDQFLDVSMKSSSSIVKNNELQKSATLELSKLIAKKSHTPQNTLRTINSMFESASEACHLDRERALIKWLQNCVVTAVEFGLDSDAAKVTLNEKKKQSSSDSEVLQPKPLPSKPSPGKKNQDVYETDSDYNDSAEERYDLIGNSDDDYVPSDDDHVVPSGRRRKSNSPSTPKKLANTSSSPDPEKKKATRKNKDDQVVPKKNEATIPLLKEGAGTAALTKYFADMKTGLGTTASVLPNGFYARAFFFPSKDSFNAFLSVLNSAKKSIDICVFAFTDDDVANTLIAAKKRGVAIRIITDNQQAAGKGADAKRLQDDYGIPYKTDNTTGYMHNKFAIIDNATLINGSFNWSKGARFKNRENVLITNLPMCIKEYQNQFDSLWQEF